MMLRASVKIISYDLLAKIINHLAGKGRIFISTEQTLPSKIQKFELDIEPNEMHDPNVLC